MVSNGISSDIWVLKRLVSIDKIQVTAYNILHDILCKTDLCQILVLIMEASRSLFQTAQFKKQKWMLSAANPFQASLDIDFEPAWKASTSFSYGITGENRRIKFWQMLLAIERAHLYTSATPGCESCDHHVTIGWYPIMLTRHCVITTVNYRYNVIHNT